MKLGRAWGPFVISLVAAVGCATATPFDGAAGDDGGVTGDDAATPQHDGASGHDSSSAHDSATTPDSASQADSSSAPDASVGMDSGAMDAGTLPDTSAQPDTSTQPDTGTTGCSPRSVSGYSPVFVPPVAKSIKCTTAAINAIYTGCLDTTATQATCTSVQTTYAQCYGCIFTNDTAASWGPVLIESNGTVRVNEGGCVQLADSTRSTCAHSIEASDGCDDTACKAACNVTDNASFMAYQSCVTSVEAAGCSTYATASSSCKSAIPSTSAAYKCVNGASFQALYNNIVPVFCGP